MEPTISEHYTDVIPLQPVNGAGTQNAVSQDQQGAVSDKSLDKKRAKEKKRLATEFTQAMSGSLQHLEDAMEHGTAAQKELARQRRRMLKEVLKAATEPSSSVDERLRYLQTKFVQLVQEQAKQDKDMLAVQAQLDVAEKQTATGQENLQRANQKIDRLQQLARSMQKENKLLSEEAELRKQQLDQFRTATQSIQERIENHSAESLKVLADNKDLLEENQTLRGKLVDMSTLLTDTQGKLENLRTTQQEQLQAIQEKLGQQNDFIQRSQELQGHMTTVLQENKLLTEQVQALDVQNKQLELLNAEYKQQLEGCRKQMKDMESGLAASQKLMKLVEKLQQDMAEHQKQMPVLMRERQLLKEQNILLQQRVKEQSEELKRSQLQKMRLEGLCRALQARISGASSNQAALPPPAAAAEEAQQEQQQQHQGLDEAGSEDVEALCSGVVKAAVAAVIARNVASA